MAASLATAISMADETKFLTMLSPLTSDSLELSPTDSCPIWIDGQPPAWDAEAAALWPQDPAFYSFATDEASLTHAMNSFDIYANHIAQTESCTSSSARSNSWHPSPSSTPPSEADLRTSRRRAQNRIAQRTYRARKENAIKEHEVRSSQLEKELSDLKTSNAKLEFGIQCLKGQVVELQQSVCPSPRLVTPAFVD